MTNTVAKPALTDAQRWALKVLADKPEGDALATKNFPDLKMVGHPTAMALHRMGLVVVTPLSDSYWVEITEAGKAAV